MLRTAVIGMGPIGNNHATAYKNCKQAELVAVCDIIKDRADKAKAKYNVAAYYNAEEMLKAEKPDIVSVATGGFEYSSDHYLPTIQALNAGCHVLTEKPISNNLKHGQEMVDLAKKLGLCFAVDLNHRFTPAARTAKKWQTDGLIGNLLFLNMALWIGRFQPHFDTEYYHLKALNPHSCDILRYFGGDVEQVHCFAMKAPGREIWSTASINMKFVNGAVGHLTSSYDIERGHPMERCEVAGTKGRLIFEDMWREATLFPAGNFEKRVYTNPVFGGFRDFYDTFEDRIHTFVQEVSENVKPENIDGSGKDGLEASRIIHAAIQSLKTNKPVIVADVTE
ncbi:MAG TPA: Gfo/Idh/MocA family oxidoreductase [Clostridia bacterium]|jgi:predicted dehydrogenase|nr:MAG: putative oxidoreductase YcjS [Firmicutes bacterium ADurb.Bin146]HOD92942.1 Gfo/Idh/MocA family oxidoreductase [Clostridia bacterium]HQM39286.1 Gfo/Idh/MocA family oxidoreductase [Clostridia bacterium]